MSPAHAAPPQQRKQRDGTRRANGARGSLALTVVEGGAVDLRGNLGQFGHDIHAVLVPVVPVLLFVDAVAVGGLELGLGLAAHDRDGELGHRVHALGEALDHLRHVRRQSRALSELLREGSGLRLGRDLAREEQPEEALRKRLLAVGRRRKGRRIRRAAAVLQLRDGVATEADALLRVQQRRLVDHAADAAHAAVRLIHGALPEDLVAHGLAHLDDLLDGRAKSLLESSFLRSRTKQQGQVKHVPKTRMRARGCPPRKSPFAPAKAARQATRGPQVRAAGSPSGDAGLHFALVRCTHQARGVAGHVAREDGRGCRIAGRRNAGDSPNRRAHHGGLLRMRPVPTARSSRGRGSAPSPVES